MNKKLVDISKSLSNTDNRYSQCIKYLYSDSDNLISTSIFNNLMISKKFINLFYEYFDEPIEKLNNLTRKESVISQYILKNKKFPEILRNSEMLHGKNMNTFTSCLLLSMKNVSYRGFSPLDLISSNFMKWCNAYNGIRIKNDIGEENSDDLYFYEKEDYKINLFKESNLKFSYEKCKNQLERTVVCLLEDKIFSKFSYSEIIEDLKKTNDKAKFLSSMQLYRITKNIYSGLLQEYIDDGVIEQLDNSMFMEFKGKMYNVTTAVEYYLEKNPYRVFSKYIKKFKNKKPSIDDINERIIDKAREFASVVGCRYKIGSPESKFLVALAWDENNGSHKDFHTYIYNGGGYRDFRNNKTGYVTDIFGKDFLKNE